ncbi:MAG: hypothetical protein KC476_05940 [Cyanobacteria bacterium HKST-UBA06]|nr:hypothetical protein [Cyanobacteria bacterium HKST-UBA06]
MQPVSFSPVSPRLAGHSLQAVPLSQSPQGGKSRQPATGYTGYAGDAPLSAQVAFGGWDRLWRWIPGLGGSSEKPASDDGLQPAKPPPLPADPTKPAGPSAEELAEQERQRTQRLQQQRIEARQREIEVTQKKGAALVEAATVMDRLHQGQTIAFDMSLSGDDGASAATASVPHAEVTMTLVAPKPYDDFNLVRTTRMTERHHYYYQAVPVLPEDARPDQMLALASQARSVAKPALLVSVVQPAQGFGYAFTIQPDTGEIKNSFTAIQALEEGQPPVELSSEEQHQLMVPVVNGLHQAFLRDVGGDGQGQNYGGVTPYRFDYQRFKPETVEMERYTPDVLTRRAEQYRLGVGQFRPTDD